MSDREPNFEDSEDNFRDIVSSMDLGSSSQYERAYSARESLEAHNGMVMNAIVKMSLDFQEEYLPETESVMLNNVFYMYEYARELSKLDSTYIEKRDAIIEYIHADNADKIEQVSRLVDCDEPFVQTASVDEITQIMEDLKLDCGGDVPVIAARVYRGLMAYWFSKYCAEAFGIGK